MSPHPAVCVFKKKIPGHSGSCLNPRSQEKEVGGSPEVEAARSCLSKRVLEVVCSLS